MITDGLTEVDAIAFAVAHSPAKTIEKIGEYTGGSTSRFTDDGKERDDIRLPLVNAR